VLGAHGAAPAAAFAHGGGGTVAANDDARVVSMPGGSVLKARVLDGDQRLWLHVAPGHSVVVLGADGRPFLRLSASGVDVDEHAPAAYAAGLGRGLPSATTPAWHHQAGGSTFAWHEPRLLPPAVAARGGQHPWQIGVVLDGHAGAIAGTTRAIAAPSLWPWLALLAAGTLATVLAMRLAVRTRELLGAILAVVGLVATAASLAAIAATSPQSAAWLQGAGAIAAVVASATLVWRIGERRRPVAGAAIAVIALYLALPLLSMYLHGAVLSRLDATPARLVAAIALGAPLASLALLIPGILRIVEPGRRREVPA
jgi:hypothetical protein